METLELRMLTNHHAINIKWIYIDLAQIGIEFGLKATGTGSARDRPSSDVQPSEADQDQRVYPVINISAIRNMKFL